MANDGDTLGSALKQARGSRSLDEAAKAAKISAAYLHKLEADRVGTPSPRVLHRLGETLQLGYWRLMELAGYVPVGACHPIGPTATEPAVAAPASSESATNADIARRLDEILAIVRRLDDGASTPIDQSSAKHDAE